MWVSRESLLIIHVGLKDLDGNVRLHPLIHCSQTDTSIDVRSVPFRSNKTPRCRCHPGLAAPHRRRTSTEVPERTTTKQVQGRETACGCVWCLYLFPAGCLIGLLTVYNLETKRVERYDIPPCLHTQIPEPFCHSQTPVINDIRDITVAQNFHNGTIALVSYENKVWAHGVPLSAAED